MKTISVELKVLVLSIGKSTVDSARSIRSSYQATLLENPLVDMNSVNLSDVDFKTLVVFKDEKQKQALSDDEYQEICHAVIENSIKDIEETNYLSKLRPSLLN